ncbi:MAG: thiamine pyrophosphate-binding protein [Magnetococcales bacterium]|nr:thiamine pyrophosphate-binding protein [Magnetococcales bacterium]
MIQDTALAALFQQEDIVKKYKRTFADLLLEYLAQIEVEYVFGVPGGAIEPLFNALARFELQDRNPKLVVARHESGAAFMADGYSRETSRLGVCCATTGPGATNLITGVASAYEDQTPMLVITAQTALNNFAKGSIQDSSSDGIHIMGMFDNCTRYNSLVSHPDQLERKLVKALVSAFHHPRGPVHLSIPLDIFSQELTFTAKTNFNIYEMLLEPKIFDAKAIDKLLKQIMAAKNIVLYLDKGAAPAIDQIMEFAELTNTPIVTPTGGKSLVSSYHPLYYGVFGFAGHSSAHQLLGNDEVDMVIAVGSDFSEFSSGCWDKSLMTSKLVHIDSCTGNFSFSPMAKQHLSGHLATIFSELVNRIFSMTQDGEKLPNNTIVIPELENNYYNLDYLYLPKNITMEDNQPYLVDSNSSFIKPKWFFCEIARFFPDNTRFVADTGNAWAWMTHYLHLKEKNNFRIGIGFAAMAWGIGAAVGTAFGNQASPVVCVTGDGSFLMSGQELTVAVANRLNLIVVVLNDSALGMVKHGQRIGGGEPIGFELPTIDFAKMATAMGANAHVLKTPQDFYNLDIEEICKRKGPTLLDVHIDPEETPPIKSRLQALNRPVIVEK